MAFILLWTHELCWGKVNMYISEIEAIRRLQTIVNEGMLSEKDNKIFGMAITALEDKVISKANNAKKAV